MKIGRLILWYVILLSTFLGAVSCPSLAKTNINMWLALPAMAKEGWQKDCVERFNAANPDIELNITLTTVAAINDRVVTAVAGGAGPDIAYYPSSIMARWIGNGLAAPLDRYMNQMPDLADFFPDVIKTLQFAGKTYAIPYSMWPIYDLYNMDLVRASGLALPATWDEMVSMARKITRRAPDGSIEVIGYSGSRNGTFAYYDLHMAMEQLGSRTIEIGGKKATLVNDAGRRAMNYLYDLWYVPGIPTGGHGLNQAAKGQVGVLRNATAQISILDTLQGEFLPRRVVGPAPNTDIVQHNAGVLFMLSSSKNPDAAWRVMQAFTSPESIKSYLMAEGSSFPSRRSLVPDRELMGRSPFAPKLMALFTTPITTYGARHFYFNDFLQPAGDILMAALNGTIGVNTALEEAERIINAILADKMK